MSINSPCFTCAKRAPSCHDSCKDFKSYRKKLEADKIAKKKFKEKYRDANAIHIRGVERWVEYKRRIRRK